LSTTTGRRAFLLRLSFFASAAFIVAFSIEHISFSFIVFEKIWIVF